MYKKLLIVLGLRSKCCGANIKTWHAGKEYCQKCERWLGVKENVKNQSSSPSKKTSRA